MSDCPHRHVEPVILFTGQHVRDLCTDCMDALPAGYDCEDCDWAELRTVSEHWPTRVRVFPCATHRDTRGLR